MLSAVTPIVFMLSVVGLKTKLQLEYFSKTGLVKCPNVRRESTISF